jgi:hypothetical protein
MHDNNSTLLVLKKYWVYQMNIIFYKLFINCKYSVFQAKRGSKCK